MTKRNSNQNMKELVLRILASKTAGVLREDNIGTKFLMNNEKTSGKIKNKTGHSIYKDGSFREVTAELLHYIDQFLEQATKSYRIAMGKV